MQDLTAALSPLAEQLARLRARARDRPAPVASGCPACGGSRWVSTGDAATRCLACLPPLAERLEAAGVPPLYREATLGGVHAQVESLALMLGEWLEAGGIHDGRPIGWYLFGPNGTGKTHLAAACCRAALERGWTARFVTARDWLAELRAVFQARREDPGSETEVQVAERYRAPRLLVLNELPRSGSQGDAVSRAVAEAVEGLIDARVNAGKLTVITANVDIAEVGRLYGQALASRLGPRHFEAVEVSGSDLRQEG